MKLQINYKEKGGKITYMCKPDIMLLNSIGSTYGWLMLMLGRKQHNSVKQLSFNEKVKKKNSK